MDGVKVVIFGSGAIAEKNIKNNVSFIVDNNKDLQGGSFSGLDIKAPEVLKESVGKYKILICTTSVGEVRKQLENYGYQWGRDILVPNDLQEKVSIDDLENEKFELLISCGLPSTAESLSGGGIYQITETDTYPEVTQIYSGNTHGLIKTDSGYAFTCQGEGIIELNNDLEVVNTIELDKGIRPHGLRKISDGWVFVASYLDAVIKIDNAGNVLDKHVLSKKLDSYGSPQHHCNDLVVVGDYAYVSMFSLTGDWKRNRFDGGVVEIELNSGDQKIFMDGLTMPHNIDCNDNGFQVLNSFKGEFLANDMSVVATLPGFVRGYDCNDNYHFLGESKNRNFSRLDPDRTPVSIDTRVTIIHKQFGFSRSIQLHRPISEIHSLILLNN